MLLQFTMKADIIVVIFLSTMASHALGKTNMSEKINSTDIENGGGLPKIDVTGKTLQEICALINVSGVFCTCDNLPIVCTEQRIFHCSRFWDKVEGIVKIIVSFIGVLGNSLVLFIAIRTWKDSTEFRRLIGFLALADLIFALIEIITAAPLFWTCKWVYKTIFCKTFKGIINFGGLFALSLVTIIALERYLAIAKPFSRSTFQLPFWLWPLLAFIFSAISVIPVFVVYGIDKDGICLEEWKQGSNGSLIYSWYLLVGTFMIPMGIISYLYYCVVKKIWANTRNLQTTGNNKEILRQRNRTNKRVMVVLLAIAVAFFVCVFPNRIIWVILDTIGTNNMANTTFRIWKYTALFPYLFHVSVNPFIYSFIDKKFKDQVLTLFKGHGVKPMLSFEKSTSSTFTSDQIPLNTIGKPRPATQQTM